MSKEPAGSRSRSGAATGAAESGAAKGPLTFRELDSLSVDVLKGVGEKRRDDLGKLGIDSILDLLMHYPRRWVDRTNECRVSDLRPGVQALVVVEVLSVDKRMTRTRKSMINVRVGDDTGKFTLTFFNQPWRDRQLRQGLTISVWGKADSYRGVLQMTNPVVDLIGDRTGRIVPIYPQSGDQGVKTWEFAAWIEAALNRCAGRGIFDPVSADERAHLGLLERYEAMRAIHLPESMAEKEAARRRLAFDELLRVQTVLVQRKKEIESTARGIKHVTTGRFVDQFVANLPFPLTTAQRRVIGEILADLAGQHPMHRLLQGDVGSGKTVVAVATLLTAVEGGFQGALMAPTEVLAEQHFAGVQKLLEGLVIRDPDNLFGDRPIRIALLTNRVTAGQRREVLAGLADGSVDIAIGTHALIQSGVEFKSLGAVVVDEQHRFGVEQRAALRDGRGLVPDTLVMTATPIPRTAAMTVYGDLDVSVLDELPPGRTPIVTHAVSGADAESTMWAAVRASIAAGDQVYVVCPLIGESDKIEAAGAESTFEDLGAGELAGVRLGLMHGRLKAEAKESVMNAFRRGDLDVLVATTVIEVGVDVPNATQIVILDADRFGIAQLHQLRGRVGRGAKPSACWLVTREDSGGDPQLVDELRPRIEALVASTDGFVLAEVDLQLRGEGTIMDKAQSGHSDLRLASLKNDSDLIEAARRVAIDIVGEDPTLESHAAFRDEIKVVFSDVDEEFVTRG